MDNGKAASILYVKFVMKHLALIALPFLFLIKASASQIEDFEWRSLDHSESKFLVPSYWETRHSNNKTIDVYVWAEKINEDDFGHELGFRIMISHDLYKNTKILPTKLAVDSESWVRNTLEAHYL